MLIRFQFLTCSQLRKACLSLPISHTYDKRCILWDCLNEAYFWDSYYSIGVVMFQAFLIFFISYHILLYLLL